MSDERIESNYIFLIDKKELQQKIYDHLQNTGETRLNLSRTLGFYSNTISNFLNGKGMSARFYKTLEKYFEIKIIEKIEVKKDERKKKEIIPIKKAPIDSHIRHKGFIQSWMIRNLKEFGNTVVCNITKKRTQKFVKEEFAKLGINVSVSPEGIATLISKR